MQPRARPSKSQARKMHHAHTRQYVPCTESASTQTPQQAQVTESARLACPNRPESWKVRQAHAVRTLQHARIMESARRARSTRPITSESQKLHYAHAPAFHRRGKWITQTPQHVPGTESAPCLCPGTPKSHKLHCAHAPARESAPPSTSQALHHANAPACLSHGNCTHAPSHGKYPRKHTSTSQARMARTRRHAQLTESVQRPRTSARVTRARAFLGADNGCLRNDCGESAFDIVFISWEHTRFRTAFSS